MDEAEFAPVLNAARAGADWAWTRLYDDLAPTVRGFLRARGAADPDDLLGEVFLQVVRDLEHFDGDEAGFRSWVFTIAYRRVIDDRRYRERRPVVATEDRDLERAGPSIRMEPEVLATFGTENVLALLEVLTEEQRDVIALRFVADLTIPEIAEAIGRTPNATKQLQRRGLRALRRHLESES